MAEEYWYPDSWTQMIKGILLESPHDRIISKTPVNSSERQLWEKNAMKLREENGLMIWEWFDTAAMEMLRQW